MAEEEGGITVPAAIQMRIVIPDPKILEDEEVKQFLQNSVKAIAEALMFYHNEGLNNPGGPRGKLTVVKTAIARADESQIVEKQN